MLKVSALKSHLSFTKAEWFVIAFLVLFSCLFVSVELNNGKLHNNDFKVYFQATYDFFQGNNPYKRPYGLSTGYFKYAPTTLYLFAPSLWVDFATGKLIHLSLLIFSLLYSFIAFRRWINQNLYFKERELHAGWLYLAFACIAIQITRELHMGNVNLLLLLFFVVGLQCWNRGNIHWKTAFWWSLMIILKPIMILIILPLFVYRQWKTIIAIAFFGLIYFLIPFIHLSVKPATELWSNWFKAIAAHGDYLTSTNAIGTLGQKIVPHSSFWILPLIVLSILVAVTIWNYFKSATTRELSEATWLFIYIAFIPNFFITDTEHFLLTFPLIIWLLKQLSDARNITYWIFFALAMALFSFHSNDLLGKPTAGFIADYGFLGIGNLVFILLAILLLIRMTKLKQHSTN